MLRPWLFVAIILVCGRSTVFANEEDDPCAKDPQQCREGKDADAELVFAHVIHNDGLRNPNDYNYPNDPNKEEKNWEGGFEQLTLEGKKQMYRMGQYFRRRYNKLLGMEYSSKKVYVQSTDYDRSIVSALVCLAGLYPAIPEQQFSSEIRWEPVPVHSIPFKNDSVFAFGLDCPKLDAERAKFEESQEAVDTYTIHENEFYKWGNDSGKRIKTIFNAAELHMTITLAKLQNKKLAAWQEELIQPGSVLEQVARNHTKTLSANKNLARLFSGPLLKEVLNRFTDKINSGLSPDRKLWIYSAHDLTISNFLNSLGLFEDAHIPPFGTSVHLELFKTKEKEHFVQIFYRRANEVDLNALEIPNCGVRCTVDKLKELYADIIPGNLEDECKV